MYENRTYRNFSVNDTVPFTVTIGESDLYIRAQKDFSNQAVRCLDKARKQLKEYIVANPNFETTLSALPIDQHAPGFIQSMQQAALTAQVGPMAAVAGAMAQVVGETLLNNSDVVIVENGGDLYFKQDTDLVVGIYAGNSVFSDKIALRLKAQPYPCGLCTSSGTVGHSYSTGHADAVSIYAKDAYLSDALATSTANKIQSVDDIEPVLEKIKQINGVLGCCIIIQDQLGVWGELELEKR